jgi:hypothetical protein
MPYPSSGAFGKVDPPINPANPAAGSQLIITFSSAAFILNQVYELLWLAFTLTTSATVIVRTVSLDMRSGGQVVQRRDSVVTQAASLAYSYGWGPNAQASAVLGANNFVSNPLPMPLMLFVVDDTFTPQLRTTIANFQAGDQISAVLYQCRIAQS